MPFDGGVLPFIVRRLGIAYFPIPKNAGTSIRHALWQLEHGTQYAPEIVDGRARELHELFPALPFEDAAPGTEGLTKIVVVREPTERLISAYRNRVVHYEEIETANFEACGIPAYLPRLPDLNTFVENLIAYRRIRLIEYHTSTQAHCLGPDLDFYDHVIRFEELNKLEELLTERSGQSVRLARLRADGPRLTLEALSKRSKAMLRSLYHADYRLLARYYP